MLLNNIRGLIVSRQGLPMHFLEHSDTMIVIHSQHER